jgi:paired amphipathic helix protein Sin3a
VTIVLYVLTTKTCLIRVSCLFRLHQTLYERILSAKVNAELAAKKKCSDGGAAPNLYAKFMEVLYGLLDGSVDNSKFEDECRAIIGTQSYVLFTLDKLIFKLVKQLQAAATDDVALKLLALNAYEKAGDAVDLVYHANSCVLLHDENIYRFEHKSNPSELLIQLMEGGSVKQEVGGHALESSFQSYLDDFLLSMSPRKNNRVFMMRCKKRNYAGGDEDEALQSAMENAVVENGLENKISCHTFKVSYVLDTADLFLRCTARRAHKHKEKREIKKQRAFGEWLDQRLRSLNDRWVLLLVEEWSGRDCFAGNLGTKMLCDSIAISW